MLFFFRSPPFNEKKIKRTITRNNQPLKHAPPTTQPRPHDPSAPPPAPIAAPGPALAPPPGRQVDVDGRLRAQRGQVDDQRGRGMRRRAGSAVRRHARRGARLQVQHLRLGGSRYASCRAVTRVLRFRDGVIGEVERGLRRGRRGRGVPALKRACGQDGRVDERGRGRRLKGFWRKWEDGCDVSFLANRSAGPSGDEAPRAMRWTLMCFATPTLQTLLRLQDQG